MISISKLWMRTLVLIAVLFGASGLQEAVASHFGAGDLFVTYIGSGPTNLKYKVTLYTYVSCEAGQASLYTTETINWTSSCAPGGTRTITIKPGATGGTGDTLDGLCPAYSAVNSCRSAGSIYPGAVRGTFEDTVTVPIACSDWVFSWVDGSRNSQIVNIGTGPPSSSGYSIYLEAKLDNTGTHWGNSTPRYLVDPVPYLCINQDDQFINGPFDPDVDSLRTVAYQPYTAAGSVIPWFGPTYTQTNPFGSAINYTGQPGPYQVNVNTGTAYFHPTAGGKYVIAFRTYDYDKYTGAQIGYISRDVQVSILPCNSTPPFIDTIPTNIVGGLNFNTASGNIITVCPGAALSFNIHSTSLTTSNQVYLKANNLITAPGSTFTVANQGTGNVTGTFNWSPTGADIGDHVILFTAADSTCNSGQPIVLKNYVLVLIKVLPGVDAGPDGHFCQAGSTSSLPWQINVTGPPGINYTWTTLPGGSNINSLSCANCPNPLAFPPLTTTYVVTSTAPQVACKNSDTITITVNNPITVDAGPDKTICANQKTVLTPNVIPLFGSTFTWSPGNSLVDSTIFNAVASPGFTTTYFLNLTDAVGCKYRDSATVHINGVAPIVHATSDKDTVCPGGSVNLSAQIAQQQCGLAQAACTGTPSTQTVGTDVGVSTYPSPFYNYQYGVGDRIQILYTKAELNAAGINAGYISSLAFNIQSKASTDSMRAFTIKMLCTPLTSIGSTNTQPFVNTGAASVVFSQSIKTVTGWNTWNFNTPYYWDGQSSLLVEACYQKVVNFNAGGSDAVYTSNTPYTSVVFYPFTSGGSGCSYNSTFSVNTSNARPNTRFTVCSSTNYSFTWSPSTYLANPNAANTVANGINNNVTYIVTVASTSNTACKGTDTVRIGVDFSNAVDGSVNGQAGNPFILCRPGYVSLNAVGVGLPPSSNLPCGAGTPINCTTPTIKTVNPSTTTSTTITSGPTPYYQWYTNSHNQYIVQNTSMSASGMHSGTLKSLAFYVPNLNPNATTTFNNFRIFLGCTTKSQFANATDEFTGLTQVYSGTANVVVGWNTYTFQTPYNWDTTQNLVVQTCFSNGSNNFTYNQPVTDVPTGNGISSLVRYTDAADNCSNLTGSPSSYTSIPSMQFSYCDAPPANFVYTWSPGQYVSDSTIPNPTAYIPQSQTYNVYTVGRNGCRVKDSVQIIVPVHHVGVTPIDTAICLNQNVQFHANGAATYQWYLESNGNQFGSAAGVLDNDQSASPIASPTDTGDYNFTIVFADQYSCTDTLRNHLHVWPLPVVNIVNNDTTIKYGQHVQLMVNDGGTGHGAQFYTWTPVGSISDPNIPNPIASPTQATTYVLFGDDIHHCRSTDTVTINIDYRDNLLVPSAFTPNGDGKNDVFRVANLTFQKVEEFRVFNRWGQEIFSAKDNHGWDGTWKDVLQDMGAYQFIIRISFPDGYVETYKGDVTLIR